MSWQNALGGLLNQVTAQQAESTSEAAEAPEANAAGGGLLGSVLGAAATALSSGSGSITDRLNQVMGLLPPEQKREMVDGLLGKLGVSGASAQALLQQLGINPAVADDPHAATPEELARLAQHAESQESDNESSDADANDAAAEVAASDESTADADQDTNQSEPEEQESS